MVRSELDEREKLEEFLNDLNWSFREAIFDFGVLAMLTYLILAYLHPSGQQLYLLLSVIYLLVSILAKLKNKYIYQLCLMVTVIPMIIGIVRGVYLESLREWGVFFNNGSSLQFAKLADLFLFFVFIWMGVYAVRGYLLEREGRIKNNNQ